MTNQDYLLHPTRHADDIAAEAPALAVILRGEEVATAARLFEVADAEAVANQREFRRHARRANVGAAGATFLAAVALAVPEAWPGWVAATLAALGGGAGFLAMASLHYLRSGDLLKEWMTQRAKAESRRLAYFSTVVAAVKGGDAALLLNALDYIRRFQLEVQLCYYDGRGKEHRAHGRLLLKAGSIAVGLGAVGTLFSVFVAPWVPVLGVFGATLASLVTTQEAMGQDLRNAERYRRTWDSLMEIQALLAKVRPKVRAGDADALELWVAALHEHLSVEHREWLAQGESTKSMLSQLQDKLRTPTPPDGQG